MDPIVFGAGISAVAMILGPAIGALISRRKPKTQRTQQKFSVDTELFLSRTDVQPRLSKEEYALLLKELGLAPIQEQVHELRAIRIDLLAASSSCELQECLLRTDEFLLSHPGHPEGLQLRSQITRAIQISRKLRIFTYLQLMMFLFVLFGTLGGILARKAKRFARFTQINFALLNFAQ